MQCSGCTKKLSLDERVISAPRQGLYCGDCWDKKSIIRNCDGCQRKRELKQWRSTHYTICVDCALEWAKT